MSKIVEIKNCPTCPYHNSDMHPDHYYCAIKGRRIDDDQIMSIPKWCPLPDDTECKSPSKGERTCRIQV
jgi:hypothetical protein